MGTNVSVIIILSEWGDEEMKTVESVLSQDMDKEGMEIIAVTSQLNEKMNEYLTSHNITIHYERTSGLGAMIAYGVEKSNSPIVTFIEGGDLYKPDRVSQSAELIDEDGRNMYHHSSIVPIDQDGQINAELHFNNIDYDLYTSQDDVPFAYHQIMRGNAGRYVSAVTCRKEALEKHLNLLHNVHQSADIALLAICLQYGGRSMFDTVARTVCRVKKVTAGDEEAVNNLLKEEKEFHIERIKDMELLERTLTQQRALDITTAEKIYSRIALSFISEEPEHRLSASNSLHYLTIGLLEHYKEFRPMMRANLLGKGSRKRARDKFIGKLIQEPWNMRM